MNDNDWEIVWSDFLTVGVPEMDAEHRKFIARVNGLSAAILGAEDKATVRRVMDLMLTEAAHHFRHEQELLDERNYPDAEVHAAKHIELTVQFNRVMNGFDEAEFSFVWAVKGLQLKKLLVEHLLKEDLKYRSFLQAQ